MTHICCILAGNKMVTVTAGTWLTGFVTMLWQLSGWNSNWKLPSLPVCVRVSLSVINMPDSLYFLKSTAASLIQKTWDVKQVHGKHAWDSILLMISCLQMLPWPSSSSTQRRLSKSRSRCVRPGPCTKQFNIHTAIQGEDTGMDEDGTAAEEGTGVGRGGQGGGHSLRDPDVCCISHQKSHRAPPLPPTSEWAEEQGCGEERSVSQTVATSTQEVGSICTHMKNYLLY